MVIKQMELIETTRKLGGKCTEVMVMMQIAV
jgi:hypothetical protein